MVAVVVGLSGQTVSSAKLLTGSMPKKKVKVRTPRAVTSQDLTMGVKIRARRRALGMSQTLLGEQLGVSFQQVQKYEKGINRVSVRRLTMVSEILGVPVAHFYSDGDGRQVVTGYGELDALANRAVKAFASISSPAVRRQIVRLAELLAK